VVFASTIGFGLLRSPALAYDPPACTGLFSDVSVSHPLCPWMEEAYYEGISSGCTSNTNQYCPDDPTTRAQVMKFIGKALHEHLWGQGRPGAQAYGTIVNQACTSTSPGIYFGLSQVIATWNEAASACPAGTWVCTAAERGTSTCDTTRPDDPTCDYRLCDDSCANSLANAHLGWLSDAASGISTGEYQSENGTAPVGAATCTHLAVWCCSYSFEYF
jgi:hypothetical protein